MFPEGKTTTPNTSRMHAIRQRITAAPNEDLIPLKMNGPSLNKEKQAKMCDRRGGFIRRLNSAPVLHSPELPPIQNSVKSLIEKRTRPLTPFRSSGRDSSASSRSLPKNYRINLDLIPLVEVGTWDVSFERPRQTSLGSDLELSSDSFISSNSPKLRSLSSSPKNNICLGNAPSSMSTHSTESLGDVEENDSPVENDGKDKMILRWLQSIERNNDVISGEVLPSIKEGRST